jgi:hypothetical protein
VQQLFLAREVGVQGTHAQARLPAEVAEAHGGEALLAAQGQGCVQDLLEVSDRDSSFLILMLSRFP